MSKRGKTPEELEAKAGRLLAKAFEARKARMAADDAHQIRHLMKAAEAGNSGGCEQGANCTLDRAAFRYWVQTSHDFPGAPPVLIPEPIGTPAPWCGVCGSYHVPGMGPCQITFSGGM